jgi:hypothetical protein
MALSRRRSTYAAVAICLVLAALWHLRDPPWLLSYSSGFHPWEAAIDGRPYRWTKGHASFFVPSNARRITLPLRSLNESPEDWPITATVTIDDRVADRMTFRDQEWHELSIRMPDAATRRVRRIDITLDRVRSQLRGVQLGEVVLHR